ncbi:MAG TPA: PQQ-binding-like beta-propeller repeat protein [Pyrinomonadaceae bacterium]|jgi:outer membrane protein assembly factor BamB
MRHDVEIAAEETAAAAPWYKSEAALWAASILLPPLGLVLLWMRRDIAAQKKVLASVCIVALAGGYLYLLLGRRAKSDNAHYTELERHRAEQQQQAAQANGAGAQTEAAANAPGQPAASGGPTAEGVQPADLSHTEASPTLARNYWTDFRGPRRDGIYDELAIQTIWPASGLRQLWKQPVGGGYASFVVAEGRAFTIEQRRAQEVVAAYDVETGRELWTHGWDAEFRESLGGDGPRATPTWHDGRVYALGAAGELRCLDARSGKLIWNRNILSDNGAENIQWGMSASPLIVDDKVIMLPGGRQGKSVVAYNRLNGAPVWRALDDEASYTSPMLVTLAGRRQILVVTAQRLVGLAENGTLLWEYPWQNSSRINVAQPIVAGPNRVFISASYGKGAALVEVNANGKGFAARTVWENNTMKNKFNSSVLHNGYVYGLDDGILSCVDVQTGERKWKGGRYGYGQLLLASNHLIVITESGELVLVRATPDQHAEVSKFPALEGRTWNVPAISNNRLLVRNTTQMAAYNLSAQ